MSLKNPLPVVEVLLATCNGEQFLREQIDSILAQDYENIRILARDDGSTDATVAILVEYKNRFPRRFRVMPMEAPSKSAKGNFLLLMKGSTAEYLCFADQDDVWLPDKVSQTLQVMRTLEARWSSNLPLLVFTDLRVVDQALEVMHSSFWKRMAIDPARIQRLNSLLVQGVVTGCTAILNRPLLDLSLRMPQEALMHDRWIALLASTMGKHAFVKAQTVLYRQHSRNVLGTGESSHPRKLRKRILHPDTEKYLEEWRANQRQAAALLRIHGTEMAAEKRQMIEAFLKCASSTNRFTRVATFLRHGFYRAGVLPNLILLWNLWTARLGQPKTGRR